jgi:hypothetical protein
VARPSKVAPKDPTADDPGVEVAWAPFAGPQTEALQRQEDEIFYGGARGGGKSAVQVAWMGRMAVEKDSNNRAKYPGFRGLLVRYQQQDLKAWTDMANALYTKFGAVMKDDPAEFHFPGGPIVYTGYLKGDAWIKYQGWNLHRFGIDEAGQVPDVRFMGEQTWPVELVMASVRGSPDGLNQSFLTGNPGNANDRRIKQRYTRVKDAKGRVIPPKATIVDPTSGKTRVFIPAVVYDNEWILKNDPDYIRRLEAMPEQVRKAWIFGDWDAFEGSFFCADEETEIFTETGFKLISDVVVGEKVATIDNAGNATFAPTTAVHAFPHEGEMLLYESKHLNFCVTPNHRMLAKKHSGQLRKDLDAVPFDFIEAQDLPKRSIHRRGAKSFDIQGEDSPIVIEWEDRSSGRTGRVACPTCGIEHDVVLHRLQNNRGIYCSRACSYKGGRTPKEFEYKHWSGLEGRGAKTRKEFDRVDFCSLLGWHLSEGSTWKRIVSISQSHDVNPSEYSEIACLLRKMGFGITEKWNGLTFAHKGVAQYLSQFGTCRDKFIPEWVFRSTRECMVAILRSLVLGDGHGDLEQFSYFSTSKRLAEGVMRLSILLGYGASISESMGGFSVIANASHLDMQVVREKIKRVHHSGAVYCVTVEPYGTILLRRKGRVVWTGNCDWRPAGPQSSAEPAHARHVLPSNTYKIAPWWWRWASLDWGFGHYAAAYKFVQNPNGQVVMSDELVRQKTGSVQLGVDIAKWMLPDLTGMPEGNMLLYISPDAIDQKRDATHTIAEKISMGMQSVLGKGGAWIAEYSEEEKELRKKDPVAALERLRRRQADEQGGPYTITIVRANNNRVDGWNHMRDLMRFEEIERAKPDEAYIQALLKANHADTLIQQYMSQFNEKEEVLPQFVALDRCKYFIEWVPTALHNPARVEDVLKTEGDDFGDAARYGLMAHRDNQGAMPKAQYVADRIAAVEASMISRGYSLEDPTMRAHAFLKIEHDFANGQDEGRMESFNLSRGGITSPFGNRRLM